MKNSMNGINAEIDVGQIKFLITETSNIPKNRYSKMTIDEIYGYLDFEEEFAITYNDCIFFYDYFSVAEFYWFLSNWYEKLKNGENVSFKYDSVEYAYTALEFIKNRNGSWSLDSVNKKATFPLIINEADFRQEIDRFMAQMKSYMEVEET